MSTTAAPKRSRSGRLIRRPSEVYVPEIERFEDDYADHEYDDDIDGSDIDTEDEGESDDESECDDDEDAGSLCDFIVDSDAEDFEDESSDDDEDDDDEFSCDSESE